MLVAGISVHKIFQHNSDIYLFKLLSVKWVLNQPKVASYYGPGLGRPPHPYLMKSFYQSLRLGGWEKRFS